MKYLYLTLALILFIFEGKAQTFNPARGATGVSISPTLTITFDPAETVTLGEDKTIYVISSDWITTIPFKTGKTFPPEPTDSRLSATGNVITIDLSGESLTPNTEFFVYTDPGALLVDGNPWNTLTNPDYWKFTTEQSAPIINTYNPLQGSSDVTIDKTLQLSFDQNIQFGTGLHVIRIRRSSDDSVFQSFLIDGVDTDTNLSIAGSVLSINHSSFEYSTQYYVTISNGAIESTTSVPFAGLSNPSDWAFTSELQSPAPTSYDPIQGSSDVAINKILDLTFDMNIQFGSLSTIKIRRSSDYSVFQTFIVDGMDTDPALSISGSTISISHNNLEYGTQYYITIGYGAIESTGGQPYGGMSGTTDWTFTSEIQIPAPVTYDPLQGATEVAVNKVLDLTFDTNIQFGSGPAYIRVRRSSDQGIFQEFLVQTGSTDPALSIAGATLSISHNDFANNTQYYVTIDNGAIESSTSVPYGGMSGTTDWTFTTIDTPPAITTYDPLQDATGVTLTKVLDLTFDKNIQFASGSHNIYIRRVSDQSVFESYVVNGGSTDTDLSISGAILSIAHANFEYNTQYYVEITNGAIESTLNIPFSGFSDPADWAFTTEVQIPVPQTYDPLQGATEIAIDKVLDLTFDTNIQFGGGPAYIRIRRSADQGIFQEFLVQTGSTDPALSIAGATLSISHNNFVNNTQYYVTIENGAIESTESIPYGGMSGTTDWTFTTIDTAPVITSYDPLQDATGIVITKVLNLTFDKNIQFATGAHNVYIRRVSDQSIFESYVVNGGSTDTDLTITGTILSIAHADFEYNTQYYVEITNGAIESTSSIPFGGISHPSDWAFTTEVLIPVVQTYDPLQGATEVAVNKVLDLTFNTNIQFGSGPSYIRIRRSSDQGIFQEFLVQTGSTDPALSIAGATLSISHNDFADYTQYYVTIDNGAIESTDRIPYAGMSGTTDWTFTSIAPTPVITAYDPLKDETGVFLTKVLNLTFDQNIQFGTGSHNIYIRRYSDESIFETYVVNGGSTDTDLSISGAVLSITHADFEYNTQYYVEITNGAIESTLGIPFPGTSDRADWAFTSELQVPAPQTYDPLQDATSVAIDKVLDLTFDINIQFGSGPAYIRIRRSSDEGIFQEFLVQTGSTDPALSIAGATLSISHNDLDNNIQYYVTIESGAIESTESEPYGGMSGTTDWTFTTISAPPVTTFDPANGTTEVNIQTNVEVFYDQAIQNTDGSEITNLNVSNLITFKNGIDDIPYTATINAGKTLITINPDSELPLNAQIDVTILPVENVYGVEQAASQNCSFTTDYFNVWNGSVSNEFHNNSNWEGGSYSGGYSVIIPTGSTNNPTISTAPNAVNNFILEPGTELTINSSGSLSVSELFELQSSNTSTIGNATLINDGTLSTVGDGELRALQAISNSSYVYYFSSPVSGATPQSIGTNETVYERNAAAGGTWNVVNPTSSLLGGVGYVSRSTAGSTWTFSGTLNNAASYTMNTYRTTSPNNYGWNLVGNPYPCSIDWDSPGITKTNLDNEFYIRINDTGQQGSYNGNTQVGTNLDSPNPSHIPSMHAFYAQVTLGQETGTLIIPKSARVSSNHTYLKSIKAKTPTPVIYLAGINGGLKDETAIAFISEASDNLDMFDTEKHFASGNNNLLELYSVNDGKQLTIDTYQGYETGKAINLGYKCAKAGTFTIALSGIANFTDEMNVELEDRTTNTIQDFTVNNAYTFTTQKGSYNDRFIVHISKKRATQLTPNSIELPINTYTLNQVVYADIPQLTNPVFYLYDISGKLIESGTLESATINQIKTQHTGLLIIKIVANEGIFSQKLLIK